MAGERGRAAGDRGAGSVLMLGLVAAALLAAAAALALGHAAVHAARAASAADLAALAAADAARGLTSGRPCEVAADAATRNGARVESCAFGNAEGTVVDVSVAVPLGAGLGLLETAGLEAGASARAGPPPEPWR